MTGYVVLAALLAVVTYGYLFERAQRKRRGLIRKWPIPSVPPSRIDPIFRETPLGPAAETEVCFIGGADTVTIPGGTSDTEAWVLAVLAKNARLMFEFGTCTGRTAYMWARNSPADARIVTLTLSPADLSAYRRVGEDTTSATNVAHLRIAFRPVLLHRHPGVGQSPAALRRQQGVRRIAVGGPVRPRFCGRVARALVRPQRLAEGAPVW